MLGFEEHNILVIDPLARTAQPVNQFECGSKILNRLVVLEEYTKKIQIESRVLGDISRNHVVPTAILYQNTLIENTSGLKNIFGEDYKNIAKEQIELIMIISNHITKINALVQEMTDERRKANKLEGLKAAETYCKKVKPFFEQIRYHCDKLETMVDDNLWPLTKYRELLFTS